MMALREDVLEQRADGNLAGLQPHFDGVDAPGDVVPLEELEVILRGSAERFLLAGVDRLGGPAELITGAGADLDEDEHIAVAANKVDLAALGFSIARQDAVAVAAHERGGDALTIAPDLRRRRQRRHRSALVSA